MIQTITLKQAPEITSLIRAAFPGYKKHKCFLSEFSQTYGHGINSYWDGGSRDEYAIVEIATGRRRQLPTASHPFFDIAHRGLANSEDNNISIDHVGNITLKHLPEGLALVQAGTFCGKAATAHVFLNSANMTKFLPEAEHAHA